MKKCRDCIHNKPKGKDHYCKVRGYITNWSQDNCDGCSDFKPKYRSKK